MGFIGLWGDIFIEKPDLHGPAFDFWGNDSDEIVVDVYVALYRF